MLQNIGKQQGCLFQIMNLPSNLDCSFPTRTKEDWGGGRRAGALQTQGQFA